MKKLSLYTKIRIKAVFDFVFWGAVYYLAVFLFCAVFVLPFNNLSILSIATDLLYLFPFYVAIGLFCSWMVYESNKSEIECEIYWKGSWKHKPIFFVETFNFKYLI